MDLNQASREALLEIIAELRQRVESLEARLSGGGPGVRMPGHKPAAKRKKPAAEEKKPRKKRQHGFSRPQMEPIGRVVHAPESCPECHTALSRRSVFISSGRSHPCKGAAWSRAPGFRSSSGR